MSKKWVAKRITVNLALEEKRKLDNYCATTGRPATDVVRELVRCLEVESEVSVKVNSNQEKNTTVAA
ncbi:CopG family transcriptional regulator [Komarekiella sp. 'clone 1']|uniref:CopG family transcriptional regulator n=1 Tax=Komarekiella delphini-convector SJRDD-AB1 TaxID=2593771 RepID=A0AA40VVH8_9NOST|nr:CopG family transcriptional regulator [Komarekiella delphini-convector]MBD6621052.1 CopG family transcriptional regulator [Komarekiella delphini-convector SJRDD-AB1]